MAKKKTKTKTRAAAKPARRAASKKTTTKKTGKKAVKKPAQKKSVRKAAVNPLFAPVKGAERRDVGRVQLEVGRAGAARVKRMIYPPGFHWSKDMRPVVGTDLCMHAHVGFLVHGEIHIEYADGCVVEHKAPQIIAIDPGHDGWVVGKEPVVLIEFDFEGDTVAKLGMPAKHEH
jgi:hypothetical protein